MTIWASDVLTAVALVASLAGCLLALVMLGRPRR